MILTSSAFTDGERIPKRYTRDHEVLDLSPKSRKRRLLRAMEGHILETALLTGTYSR